MEVYAVLTFRVT